MPVGSRPVEGEPEGSRLSEPGGTAAPPGTGPGVAAAAPPPVDGEVGLAAAPAPGPRELSSPREEEDVPVDGTTPDWLPPAGETPAPGTALEEDEEDVETEGADGAEVIEVPEGADDVETVDEGGAVVVDVTDGAAGPVEVVVVEEGELEETPGPAVAAAAPAFSAETESAAQTAAWSMVFRCMGRSFLLQRRIGEDPAGRSFRGSRSSFRPAQVR